MKALCSSETSLHSKLDSDVERVVAKKNILLFKEMLSDIGYDDMSVVDLLTVGVKVVGDLPKVGIWKPDDKRARITVKAALYGSKEAKERVSKPSGTTWSDIDETLVESTYKEVSEGHLLGPFTEKQMDERLGSKVWLPARRFPIKQGDKVRPIDDFSENGHNWAFGTVEKIELKSLDTVVALSRAWLESIEDGRDGECQVKFTDTAGKVWRTELSPEWRRDDFIDLVGRVADLKGAYKQLACCPAHKCFGVIALQRKDSGTEPDVRADCSSLRIPKIQQGHLGASFQSSAFTLCGIL